MDRGRNLPRAATRNAGRIESFWEVVHNSMMVRHFFSLLACLALLFGFVAEPHQHLHVVANHEGHLDLGNSAIVHVHPYALTAPPREVSRPHRGVSSQGHAAWSLDSFAAMSHAVPCLFFAPESSLLVFASPALRIGVDAVQPCGHDPPDLAFSVPRAPPA